MTQIMTNLGSNDFDFHKNGSFMLADGAFTIYEAADGTWKTAEGKTIDQRSNS